MIPRPCLECGELTNGSRCPQHRLKETRTGNRSHPHLHTAKWERLSKHLRKLSPFCETCGNTTHLSVDHIIPTHERPDLIFNTANLRVLCSQCNARRGDQATDQERQQVLDAIARKR